MKPEQVHAGRLRMRYRYRDGIFTFSLAAMGELQRRTAMTKEQCAEEDETVNAWLRGR